MGIVSTLFDLIFLFSAIIVGFILYPFWINFVYRFNMGEDIRSDGPTTHLQKRGTPTMGGMVFVITVFIVSIFFNRSRTQTLFPLFIASIAGLLGIVEDFTKVYRKSGLPGFIEYHFGNFFKNKIHTVEASSVNLWNRIWNAFKSASNVVGSGSDSGLQTYHKFIFQGVLALFVVYWTYVKLGWDFLWFPLIGNVHIGFLYPIFVFLLFIVILNSVAFTDGLDGLAGGLSVISFLSFWILARLLDYNSLATFCATFVGALIPFMYFNIYPARIFMGNVGSHVLGATLAILAIVMHREVAFIFIGLVFFIDGVSSPLQQLSVKFTKKRIFRMAPLHHHFELLGWPETKVTLRFLLFGFIFAFLGVFIGLL